MLVEASQQLPHWRSEIVLAAMEAMHEQMWVPTDKACRVEVVFFLPRPKTVKRDYPTTTPDLDKLLRGLFDACTAAKIWSDDSVAVDVVALKRYADEPGCSVTVTVM